MEYVLLYYDVPEAISPDREVLEKILEGEKCISGYSIIPSHEITKWIVGEISSYYGELYIEQVEGKFYWGIPCHSSVSKEEITRVLFDILKGRAKAFLYSKMNKY